MHPREALDVAAESRAFFTEGGVSLAGDQATKTRAALDFFARQLATPAVSGRPTALRVRVRDRARAARPLRPALLETAACKSRASPTRP